jgi:hypothetical protein
MKRKRVRCARRREIDDGGSRMEDGEFRSSIFNPQSSTLGADVPKVDGPWRTLTQ